MQKSERIDVRGVGFDSVDLAEATAWARQQLASEERSGKIIHTPNSEIVQLCIEKNEYYEVINGADLVIPDGVGVILASKILRRPLNKGKVAGVELFEQIVKYAAEDGYKLFFYGGKPGVAEEAARRLADKYPSINIVGVLDGYGKDDAITVQKINESGADMLFVCLGVPKQEDWMRTHRAELSIKLMGGFGGSLDVFAGNVKRAPKIFIKLGLEWFYRLCKEPKRIGRMMKLPKFLFGTIWSKVRRG